MIGSAINKNNLTVIDSFKAYEAIIDRQLKAGHRISLSEYWFKIPVTNNFFYGVSRASFLDCIFDEKIVISDQNLNLIELNFGNCEVKKSLEFIEKEMKFDFYVMSCDINELNLFELYVRKEIELCNSRINHLDFSLSVFNRAVIFEDVSFQNLANLYDISTLQSFKLYNCQFNNGLNLADSIFEKGIDVFNIGIKNFKSISYLKSLSKSEVDENNRYQIFDVQKRQTFYILKKELLKSNNNLEHRKLLALEKVAYLEVLKSESAPRWERFILWLGGFTNNHGENWLRALIFTCLSGLFLFYISILQTEKYSLLGIEYSWANFKENVELFFVYFWPAHSPTYADHLNPNWFFYVVDFLGRITVAFGIYQIIVAFRKFSAK